MSLPEHMLADWPVLLFVWALAAAGGWLTGRKLRQWLGGLRWRLAVLALTALVAAGVALGLLGPALAAYHPWQPPPSAGEAPGPLETLGMAISAAVHHLDVVPWSGAVAGGMWLLAGLPGAARARGGQP